MTLAGTLAIASGGTNATTAAAALTNLGAAPLASPSFTGTVNVAALTFNGIPMGGACIAGAFVQSISNSGVPTCGSNLGTSYAPLTNPAGGQNNYAPLASPVFTGTPSLPTGTTGVTQTAGTNNTTLATTAFVTAAGGNYAPLINPTNGQNNYAPLASPTFTGTITFPDGTTATTAGFNTMKALGIGGAVGAINSTDILDIVSNSATGGGVALQNTSGGANVIAGWNAGNGTYVTYVGTTGTGYVNPNVPASVGQLATNAVNGLEVMSLDNVTTAPIKFWAMGAYQGQFRAGGLDINVGSTTAGADSLDITGNGTSSYLINATQNANISAIIQVTNPNAGTQVQNGFGMTTGTGGSIYPTALVAFGPGWTANPFFPGSTAALETSEPNGLYIGTNTSPNSINFNIAGSKIATWNQNGLIANVPMYTGVNPTVNQTFDAASSTVTIATGSNAALPNCAGLVLINDQILNGAVCFYLTGRGAAVLVAQTGSGNYCVTNTTAPPAGEMSIGYNGTTYAIYNNLGGTVQLGVMNFCTRHAAN
jgi:hypothetical protein